MSRAAFACLCLLIFGPLRAMGQDGSPTISTFGYFQVSFQHQNDNLGRETQNSFSAQQLNLIFQTDLSPRWRAFVDFELLNNFSSSRRWGSFNLNEAWLNFRAGANLNVKAGLHVPAFNHLNEIKNRTPLLPYVIRPLVYEESFGEFIDVEAFLPERAFLQIRGLVPLQDIKLDYAAYLGNSPNINSQFDNERTQVSRQTGIDTTATILVGGRLGLRYGFDILKLGVSVTRESDNFLSPLENLLVLETGSLSGAPKTRLGVDVSFRLRRFTFDGEFIDVNNDIDLPPELKASSGQARPRFDLDRRFVYGTLGYHATERLFVYASYWYTDQFLLLQSAPADLLDDITITVPTAGFRYTLLQDTAGFDRIILKAQCAYALIDVNVLEQLHDGLAFDTTEDQRLTFGGVALSVLF